MLARKQPQLPARQNALGSRERREAERRGRIERLKGRNSGRKIARQDLPGRNGQASGVRQGGLDREAGQEPHCVTLFTCWYISSAALTTLELAS